MGSDNLDIPKELFSPSDEFVTAAGTIGLHWWFWNLEERKFSMSPGLLRLLGYTPEEYDPSRPYFYENIHPDDVRDNRNRIRKLLSGEASLYEIEYRVKAEKGAWQWYYNRGTVIKRDHEGKPVIVGGITMDISGPFKHLLSKVEEKDKFEFIFRNTHEAMLIIEINNDGKGRVIDSNQAATELFGRKRDEILGNIPQEYLKNDRTGTQSDYIQELLEKGYARYEMQVDLRDNELRWLEFTTKAISLTGENLFLTMVEDKTIDKRTKAALRESERLYRTLFEAAEDRIVLFDEEGEILLYSTSFYSSLGYTKEEFDALDSNETIHPDDRERLKLEGRKIFTVGHSSHEYRVMHKQGHYLHMASKNVLIPVEPNEKILVLSISRDMTERKKAMRDLELARDHAEESDRLKSAFLANMSHEIRTPMNSIVGFSNLLVNQNLEEETRSVYVARIIRNSELLLTLISDIIDLAKIESGQLSIIYGKQKISDLVAEIELYALDELKRLGKDNIRIHAVNNDRDCMLETDLMRVSQVLKNLVNNAIKFTEEGTIEIGCRLSDDGENVVLFVKDTGIGISREHFDLIFNQFRQVDGSNTRKFGGTGLGLAICRHLVQMMGGRIWVESEPGKGALFQLELPLKADPSPITGPETRKEPASVPKDPGKQSILVVDDQPDTLEVFRFMLSALGHTVTTASNGYEALKQLDLGTRPQLIFMDVQLPVLSGTEILSLVKKRYPDIRVVAQSAHALTGDRERFLDEGYDAYLPKPFTDEQLTRLLSSLFTD